MTSDVGHGGVVVGGTLGSDQNAVRHGCSRNQLRRTRSLGGAAASTPAMPYA